MRLKPLCKLIPQKTVQGKPVVLVDNDYGLMSLEEIEDYILADCGGNIP